MLQRDVIGVVFGLRTNKNRKITYKNNEYSIVIKYL